MRLLPFNAIFPNKEKSNFLVKNKKLYVDTRFDNYKGYSNYTEYFIKSHNSSDFVCKPNNEIYLAKKKTKSFEVVGVIGKVQVDELFDARLLQHEETIQSKVDIYIKQLGTYKFFSAPIILAHEDNSKLEKLYQEETKNKCNFEFNNENESYFFWELKSRKHVNNYFSGLKSFFLADGHHRIAALKELEIKHVLAFFILKKYLVSSDIIRYYTDKISDQVIRTLISQLYKKYRLTSLNNKNLHTKHINISYKEIKLAFKTDDILSTKHFLSEIYFLFSNHSINFQNKEYYGETLDSSIFSLYIPNSLGKKLISNPAIFPPHSTYFEPKFLDGVISSFFK